MPEFGTVGVIGRWKPLHKGGALMLEAVCSKSAKVKIGIGSCNKYDVRNPFTSRESREMIEAELSEKFSNYEFLCIPDYGHLPEYQDGKKWVETMTKLYGPLDAFITANDYVSSLLNNHYRIVKPYTLIPEAEQIMVCGTIVRIEMAIGESWRGLVTPKVEDYIEKNGLASRFRREFGLETIASLAYKTRNFMPEGLEDEKNNVLGR